MELENKLRETMINAAVKTLEDASLPAIVKDECAGIMRNYLEVQDDGYFIHVTPHELKVELAIGVMDKMIPILSKYNVPEEEGQNLHRGLYAAFGGDLSAVRG